MASFGHPFEVVTKERTHILVRAELASHVRLILDLAK